MKNLQSYSTEEFKLTEGEQEFISKMLRANGCFASNPDELLEDNFSCQTIEDFRKITDLSKNQIAGYISSLNEKNVIAIEERDGVSYTGPSKIIQMDFEPDLYWVTDDYLESLPAELKF